MDALSDSARIRRGAWVVALLIAALAVFAAPTARAQQIIAQPVVKSAWTGFGADFRPDWSGETKRIDWRLGGGGGGSGVVTTVDFSPPRPPTPVPIGLISARREYEATSGASIEHVYASATKGGPADIKGWWSPDAAQYAEVVNLQDILLSRGGSIGEINSELMHASTYASGRVSASAFMNPEAIGHGSASAIGKSNISATYRVTDPVWFEMRGRLSGSGALETGVSLTNALTNQPLYAFSPAITATPSTWSFNLAGVLAPGQYTVSISATTQALINSTTNNGAGGAGEYDLSFVASPRKLGDVDGNGLVGAPDLQAWKARYGYSRDADFNRDDVIDGRDFLAWQQTYVQYNDFLYVDPVIGWLLPRWKSSYGRSVGGDANGDRDVDGTDFLMWQRKLGAGPSVNAVPEPAAWLLTLVAAVATGLRRSRASLSAGATAFR